MTVWRRARPLVLAVSVGLNLAILSVWGAQAIPAYLRAETVAEGEMQSDIWCPLHRALGVSEAQWRQIEPGLLKFHQQVQEHCRRLQQWRDELVDLVAAPQPDMASIQALQRKILEGQGQMQDLVVRRLLAERQVLTAAQQEQLYSMIRSSMRCPGPAGMMGPPGMPGMGPQVEPQAAMGAQER